MRALTSRFAHPAELEKLLAAVACGIAASYALVLITAFREHVWIIGAGGHPLVNDFVVFSVVGHFALKGAAVAAYNARIEHAAELTAIGHHFKEVLGWSYPPIYLFVVAGLAGLPYWPGFILWEIATLALYATVVATITARRAAFAMACAAPWVGVEFILGQNGFLTAAIVGLVLLHLEKRPILSGILLGLLSYKPQFGVLFPLALAAGGYWRAFGWAAVSAIIANGAAGAVFGFDTFPAFLHALPNAAGSHLIRSDLGWNKLQSFYGLLRYLGAPAGVAWTAEALACIAITLGIILCWRNRGIPYPLKAASLAAAIPLVTPYILYYDVPMLAVTLAFLFRDRGFDKTELYVIAPAMLCLFAPFFITVPSGLLGTVPVGALVLRRLHAESRSGKRLFTLDARARQEHAASDISFAHGSGK